MKINPIFFSLLRDISSFPYLLFLARILEGKSNILNYNDYFKFMILGFIMCLNQVFYITALDYISPSICR